MNNSTTPFRSLLAVVVAVGLLATGLAGCGGGSGGDDGPSREMNMVTVNWIEGMAFTYLQERLLEDSLDMEVDVREVSGGGIAFKSVASGDRDYFNEAWLPTTHQQPWDSTKANAQKLGYTYKGTSVGLTVPAYMDITSVTELPKFRDQLNGEINGIESGAAVNDQTRQILKNNNIEGFKVVASSGPATWQALENAISNKEPIVVTGWYPHWKWGSYDLKYLEGAQTGQSPVFGEPEDIFKIVDNQFVDEFPKKVVCLLKHMEVNDQQIESLMDTYRNREGMSKEEAAAQWIQNHPEDVAQWMNQAEECAASEGPVETLPDDATFSRS
ncbi:ABC transporter substrate-binding protein [Salinibacter sp. 10B]|uniref:glycine betaine ABC transporter substrate-binding protein n=1 Tax=Salinibacter sp. 10B TaxID=1923971 RepID=UPI000CF3A7EA|nr:glycine betaine ABC transporter substrate-binding protein [Salinibacter sp. 10B]PQJ35371.1 ABC transporter substrate-binding protein [Salinibacter sp. 10B]